MPIDIKVVTKKLESDHQIRFAFGDLDFTNANKEDIEKLATFIKTSQNRDSVSFDEIDCSKVSLDKLSPLLKAIKENPKIVKLSFHNSKLEQATPETLKNISECIIAGNIESLCISSNNMGASPKSIQFLIDLAKSKVRVLNGDSLGLESCDFKTLKDIMQSFAKVLTSLNLNFISFNKDNTQECQILSILLNSKIEEISFNYAEFWASPTIERWDTILTIFSKTTQLRSLVLSSCGLGLLELGEETSGTSQIFINRLGSFLESTTIRNIDISYNDFSKEATISLIKAAAKNTGLKLTITGNNLTNKEIEDVRQACLTENKVGNSSPATPALPVTPAFTNKPSLALAPNEVTTPDPNLKPSQFKP